MKNLKTFLSPEEFQNLETSVEQSILDQIEKALDNMNFPISEKVRIEGQVENLNKKIEDITHKLSESEKHFENVYSRKLKEKEKMMEFNENKLKSQLEQIRRKVSVIEGEKKRALKQMENNKTDLGLKLKDQDEKHCRLMAKCAEQEDCIKELESERSKIEREVDHIQEILVKVTSASGSNTF